VESTERWLPIKKWDACAPDKTAAWRQVHDRMAGRPCFGAFDVSSTRDITAMVWAFPPQDGEERWTLACRFWVPEETLADRIRQNPRVPFAKWIDDGALETTPGDFVDQGFVERASSTAMSATMCRSSAYDPWNAGKLIADLQKNGVDPELLVLMRQGIMSMGEPSKHFERLVFAGQLDHGGHPLLRWMAGNVTIRFDENLNFMPAKKRSAEKIDGIVAGVMAIGVAMASQTRRSVYESRGVRVI
jgi:phage terminase large subunit-like protein